MLRWRRGLLAACVWMLGVALPCLAQNPTGPRTLENLVNSGEAQETPAVEAEEADSGPKRPSGTVARPKNGVQHPDLNKAWAEYDAVVAQAAEEIKAAISKQFDAATAKGDLDAAEHWQTALEKFEKAGEVPSGSETKAAVNSAVADYKRAKDALSSVYESVVKSLTMEKKIAEAKKARDEGASIAKAGAPPQEQKPEKQARVTTHRVDAGKSWQPTIEVVAGKTYLISAQGKWTSNVKSMPWQGADFLGENGLRCRVGEGTVVKVGSGMKLTPTETGVLSFELFGNAKSNDRGFVDVRIEPK